MVLEAKPFQKKEATGFLDTSGDYEIRREEAQLSELMHNSEKTVELQGIMVSITT